MKVYKLWDNTAASNAQAKVLGAVITPDTVTQEIVTSAWSYAIRYSAKGLDVVDYDAALKLLAQRHPHWQYAEGAVGDVWYKPQMAENDEPD